MGKPWNVNIHYDGLLARCVPTEASSVLEVGCGDRLLAPSLLDAFPGSSDSTRTSQFWCGRSVASRTSRSRGSTGTSANEQLTLGTFDAVVSNAALHHLGATDLALRRLAAFVRPGGVLAVVGFVPGDWRDLPWLVSAYLARGAAMTLRGKWEHTAPQS